MICKIWTSRSDDCDDDENVDLRSHHDLKGVDDAQGATHDVDLCKRELVLMFVTMLKKIMMMLQMRLMMVL